MSKLGENVDIILGQFSEGERLSVNELKKKVPLNDAAVLNFMNHAGLIELKKGEVRITGFGLALLKLERPL